MVYILLSSDEIATNLNELGRVCIFSLSSFTFPLRYGILRALRTRECAGGDD